jgi:hypothetical protein
VPWIDAVPQDDPANRFILFILFLHAFYRVMVGNMDADPMAVATIGTVGMEIPSGFGIAGLEAIVSTFFRLSKRATCCGWTIRIFALSGETNI